MTIRQTDSFLRGSAFWFTFGRLSPFYHLCFIGFLPMPSHQIRPALPSRQLRYSSPALPPGTHHSRQPSKPRVPASASPPPHTDMEQGISLPPPVPFIVCVLLVFFLILNSPLCRNAGNTCTLCFIGDI